MNAPIEFTVDDHAYKARPMDAFTQMDIVAIISPIMLAGAAEVPQLFADMRERGIVNILDLGRGDLIARFSSLAHELAKMAPSDRRMVIAACLELVERRVGEGKGWAPIWSAGAGQAMFEDINTNAWVMVRIAAHVCQGTFGRFFPDALSPSRDAGASLHSIQ